MSVAAAPTAVPAARLRAMLADGGELALLDVREELPFSESHLLLARSSPLSRLELRVPLLVPRRSARVVLVDGGEGLAARAAQVLRRHGYTDLSVLEGGTPAWEKAGFALFSGVNVPSKAFGEVVEHASATPNVDARELKRMVDAGEDLVVLDSRPWDEFTRMSIPTARNVPGAELVLRVADLAPSPRTTVVVNCAGRTRSIIGAQSLIDAGVPNRVVALRNGTMGWTLAGLAPDRGSDRRLPMAPPSAGALAWAKAAAGRVAARAGVARVDTSTLERWRREERTLFVFDVRDPREYAAGHLPGALSAPGGQLVQATDQYVGTLNARIVLVDDLEVRALMTGAWLRQMGWKEVFALAASGSETGWPAPPVLGTVEEPRSRLDAAALSAMTARRAATVIDLSLSREYRKAHIPGASFAIRSRLDRAIPKIDPVGTMVLTSEDGVLAALALEEMRALTGLPVRYLGGGNAAWTASGCASTAEEPRFADEPVDVWLKPYDRAGGQTAAMQAYLDWEVDLLTRVERDGTCRFERHSMEA
ncbi:MAG TPA: rhodanese-like domain-containing protein [Burkholderiales bacterium]|nr:rhodanese-like domain-containing protein [Burkholderiales bacterium]